MSKPFRLGIFSLCLAAATGFAGGATNGYSVLAQNKTLALKAPAVTNGSPATAAIPPAKIKLVGLAAIPPCKWAVIQIQEPGRPAVTVTLKEGCGAGPVEILDVDARAQQVKIRNAGKVMTIAFEDDDLIQKNALAKLEAEHPPLPTVPLLGAGDP